MLEAAGAGAGRHVIDLASGLVQRSHDVHLAYSAKRAESRFVAEVSRIPDLTLHTLNMQRAVGISDIRAVTALRRLAEDAGPFDIVHAHSSKAGALSRIAFARRNTPVIYTPHAYITLDPDLGPLKRLFYTAAERLLAPLGTRTICVSEHEARHAAALGIGTDRRKVIHNGIEPLPAAERRAVRDQLGLAESVVCIGTVGRLTAQKAVDRMITAFSMLRPTGQEVRLIIVGDGPERAGLETLADTLGLSRTVVFTGAADGQRLMSAFDVFALTSRYEAFPYVLVEAAARGLPIVMTDTGGAGSIVNDQANGFVVPQGDLERFAAVLSRLVRDADARYRMGTRSARTARAFTADGMVDETVSVYLDCLPKDEPAQ